MATRPFEEIAGLLVEVEQIVLETHRELYAREGKAWSPPVAYRWLHYEDPDPVRRLTEGVDKLLREGAEFDAAAVDKACTLGASNGFSN